MSESTKQPRLVIFTIVAMAAVFAISLFLGGLYLNTRRTDNPSQTTGLTSGNTTIDNKTVIFNIYPDEAVVLLPPNDASGIGEGGANPTPAPILPTPIPATAVPPTSPPPPTTGTAHTFPETPIQPWNADTFVTYLGRVRDSFRSFNSVPYFIQ